MILKSLLNVLRDPAGQEGNGQPPPQSASTPPQSAQASEGLSSDQQKVAAAIDKANASAPPDGPKQPRVHKNIFVAPPAALLEKDFSLGEADAPLVEGEGSIAVKIENDKADNTKGAPPQNKTVVPQQQPPKPSTEQAKPPVVTPPQVKVTDAKVFDYSTFTPEEITHLKQMSNPAREWVAKNIKDLKALQGQKPDVYYQHQDAYTLDPQYKELSTTRDWTSKEADHWKQQLLNIRQGKPWMFLSGYDDKGNPILTGPHKASDEADINISSGLQTLMAQLMQMQQQKTKYGTQYQEQIKRDNALLDAEMASRFEWVKDPAKLEEKVDVGGKIGQVPIKQIRDDFKSLFAKYHHGSPLLDMGANMFVALQIYAARIRELEGSNQHQQRLTADVLSGEPNVETQVGNGKPEGKEFDMAGLPD